MTGRHVRYWPKADILSCTAHVRFQGVKRTGVVVSSWILISHIGTPQSRHIGRVICR
jgi:hypothetical protein